MNDSTDSFVTETLKIPKDAGLEMDYTFRTPPKANWKWSFGDSPDVYFQFYIKNPPNAFQRWFLHKLTGIKWIKL